MLQGVILVHGMVGEKSQGLDKTVAFSQQGIERRLMVCLISPVILALSVFRVLSPGTVLAGSGSRWEQLAAKITQAATAQARNSLETVFIFKPSNCN
jgi:radical SAM superfamily enzyme with C-terminal helix-hairpin-helix motif